MNELWYIHIVDYNSDKMRDLILTQLSRCSVVKNLPAKQEMRVQSLGQEDPLEKEMAIHSSILARIIPRTGICLGLQRVRHHRAHRQHTPVGLGRGWAKRKQKEIMVERRNSQPWYFF